IPSCSCARPISRWSCMASAQPRQPVANPAQSGNPCAVARVSRVEANPQAASVLGYAPAELLALKADQIFSTGRELWQQITTDNRASSHSGGKLVTKHGRSLWPVMTAHTVVHHGRAAVLVIAHDTVPTRALAPSGQASAIRPDVAERTEEPAEVIE